ncbi:MAG: dephospho-CoA kinase [Fimbriimonadaceae bacterium]|nr:dephospho-CoA kinase [Chthonomonadaceae bacterium]MCO5298298.1 dephospho-CoA kinase [Fimbriimonadaceae bacterium]
MRLAITGGIAEGKSTVAAYLASWGVPVVSADEIARDVYRGARLQAWLASEFDGEAPVERDRVRARVARDAEFRRALNARMHPEVIERIFSSGAIAVEIPLLVEACLQRFFPRVWVVTCGEDEQLRRLAARLNSVEKARALIETQLPTRVKIAFADRVIRTNAPEHDVHVAVTEAAALDFA